MLLVTTALEETWGTNERLIFLGEWCKLYSRQHIWKNRPHETLSYNWDDRKLLAADSEYLTQLYERLLPDLSVALNKIHRTSHSEKYWKILIGPWLGFFTQILFQRWSSIENATRTFPVDHTIFLTEQEFYLVPNDMQSFVGLFSGDEWNHYICSRIIKHQNCIAYDVLPSQGREELKVNTKFSMSYSLKNILRSAWNICWAPLATDADSFFIATGLPKLTEISLKLGLGQVPQYSLSESTPFSRLDKAQRQWRLNGLSLSKFESFVREIIPQQIPRAYIEGYLQVQKRVVALRWPKSPKLIFTSVAHVYDDLVKTYIAKNAERGSLLVIGQHGGGSFHELNFQTDHELDICDKYLSPGLGNTWHPKVKDVGQVFARNWRSDVGGGGLLMQLGTPRYSFSIASTTQSDDFNKYIDEQMRFVASLPKRIQDEFTIRLTSAENQWSNSERWRDRFPDVYIDAGDKDVHALFARAKIIVCTYAGTTYNQALAANAPTVIFWNPKYERLHHSSDPIFKELLRVGIFHNTPESAAAHIAQVWENVNDWWQSTDLQEVRKRYCRSYAFIPENSLIRLRDALQDVLSMRLNVNEKL